MQWNTLERRFCGMETEVEMREGSVEEGKGKEKKESPHGRIVGLQKRPFFCYHAVTQTTAEAEKGRREKV